MIGRSMLAYIPVNFANLLVSFGTIVILTRLLNSEEFGRYALAVVSMHFTHMALFTWLEAAMARFQARAEKENDVNSHLRTIYSYAGITALMGISFIMVTLALIPLEPTMKLILVAAMTATTIQIFMNLGMEAHKAAHRIKRYSVAYSSQTIFSFSVGILLILFTPLREVAPFIGIMIGLILALIIDLPFMFNKMKGGAVQHKKIKRYFNYGMPICISLLLAYALNSADMYIIAGLMGESSAGQYNAGYNLSNRTIEMIFVWVSMAVTPIAITKLEQEGLEKSRIVMRDYGATLLWITMPAATGIALVANELGFVLGESVREGAVSIMPLIAFAGVLNGLISYYAQRSFMLSGKTIMFMWAMVPPVVLNIALNFWLIPKLGLIGAVYATLISYTLGFVLAMIVGRRYYPLPFPLIGFLKIALCCSAMAIVIRAINIPSSTPDFVALFIKAGIGALTYMLTSLTINAADCRTYVRKILHDRRLRSKAAIS